MSVSIFNIYCDESCHLENDGFAAMVLGAIWCPDSHHKYLARKVKQLKKEFKISANNEIKWTKVSKSKLPFYKALVDLFFNEPLLYFRAVVIPDKSKLNHASFMQSHDDFYYKQWYLLLNRLIAPNHNYKIYLDIKDTKGQEKVIKLHEVLCNANYDFDRMIIHSIDLVQSHDVLLLQLADLFIGALSYLHRGLKSSEAKIELIHYLQNRSQLSLQQSTLLKAEKFNLFIWSPQY